MGWGKMFSAMVLGSVAASGLSAYDDWPTLAFISTPSSKAGRAHSSGTRSRRQWKRRRASGITKRVRG